MYLSILIFPLLASFVSGFLGRKIGITGAHILTCTCLSISSLLATIAFYEVGICGSPVNIYLFSWIESEFMSISWEFLFDQLTVSMFIPVLYISTLIHIYTTSYLAEDPHNQRFFSYLSLFTFFMLLLISGANYFVMFIGWEGILECLKWNNNETLIYNFIFISNGRIKFNASERIGPHNIDIISLIIGSTLGDTHLEKRDKSKGTRVIFEQSNRNVEYLMWYHKYLSIRGYCSTKKPKLNIRIKQKGKIFYHYRINSYTYSSFNWIHEMFYKKVDNKYVKFVPLNIEEYLTPLALAVWFMDDGSSFGKGARIATNCLTLDEILFLCEVLKNKYGINATPIKCGKNKGYIIYIDKNSMNLFSSIIKPYLLPSLNYKLGK